MLSRLRILSTFRRPSPFFSSCRRCISTDEHQTLSNLEIPYVDHWDNAHNAWDSYTSQRSSNRPIPRMLSQQLIAGLAEQDQFDVALSVFQELIVMGDFIPLPVYFCLLRYFRSIRRDVEALSVYKHLRQEGLFVQSRSFEDVIKCAIRGEKWPIAQELFNERVQNQENFSSHILSTMVEECLRQQDWDFGIHVYHAIKHSLGGFDEAPPNLFTFQALARLVEMHSRKSKRLDGSKSAFLLEITEDFNRYYPNVGEQDFVKFRHFYKNVLSALGNYGRSFHVLDIYYKQVMPVLEIVETPQQSFITGHALAMTAATSRGEDRKTVAIYQHIEKKKLVRDNTSLTLYWKALFRLGEFAQIIDSYEKTNSKITWTHGLTHYAIIASYIHCDQVDVALSLIEQEPNSSKPVSAKKISIQFYTQLCSLEALVNVGRPDQALACIERWTEKTQFVRNFKIISTGQYERMMDVLARAQPHSIPYYIRYHRKWQWANKVRQVRPQLMTEGECAELWQTLVQDLRPRQEGLARPWAFVLSLAEAKADTSSFGVELSSLPVQHHDRTTAAYMPQEREELVA